MKDARERNLLMKITNWAIQEGGDLEKSLIKLDNSFNEDDMHKELFFKKSDIKKYSNNIFDDNGNIKREVKSKITEYITNHYKYKNVNPEDLKNIYEELTKQFGNYSQEMERINDTLSKAIEIAKKVHWRYIPVYKEQYIENNGFIPEDNLIKYYNHYHAIEDLYRYIYTDNKINWKSIEGDINIGVKLTFKIYTTRWGHYDYYSIKRTEMGWDLSGLPAGTGSCKVNGEGALISALKHDSVCYPEGGLEYAMETLWNEADTTEMKPEIVQKRLDDISEWIKAVEIATHQAQPEWCGYY